MSDTINNVSTTSSTTQEASGTTVVVTSQNNTTTVKPTTTNTTTSTTNNTSSSSSTSTNISKSTSAIPVSGGTSVKMEYNALDAICDDLIKITKDLSDQWASLDSIIKSKDKMWTGAAADRYFDGLVQNINQAKTEALDTNFYNYILKVKALIELNRSTDKIINEQEIQQLNNTMPTISGTSVTTNAHTTNDALNDSVKANDNIKANSTTTNAHTTDDALNNSVKANDNIQANSTTTDAHTTDDALNDSVHVNGNIKEVSATTDARTTDDELLDSVHVSGSINSGTSASTESPSNTTDDALEDLVKAYAQATE